MLSVLILTRNEEQNLPRCLGAVSWSNDIVVVDSFSTDKTVAIAKDHGARVLQNPFVNFAQQRNYGLAKGNLSNDWILHLDADEVVTPELKRELFEVVDRGEKDAYRVASKVIFQGHWLKRSGLYPWYQVRLGRREKLTFKQIGHGQREDLPADRLGTLNEPLLHYSFSKGISDWFERHNRYSTAEAEFFVGAEHRQGIDWAGITLDAPRRRRTLKQLFSFLPCRPMLRFLYMYFFRLGFLDGQAGFTYCRLLSIYEYFTVLKIRELRRRQKGLPP